MRCRNDDSLELSLELLRLATASDSVFSKADGRASGDDGVKFVVPIRRVVARVCVVVDRLIVVAAVLVVAGKQVRQVGELVVFFEKILYKS